MPHIIILDENGIEIGRAEHPPEEGGLVAEPDHEAMTVTVNLKHLRKRLFDDKEKK